MSGATGAGSADAGDASGANGASGSASYSQAGGAPAEGRGMTVTDTRGPQPPHETYGGEQAVQQGTQPYHPPQAYPSPPGGTQGGQQRSGQQTAAGATVRRPRTGATTQPRTRKARLRVAKADPWSVMKVSFLLSIALGICTIVAAAVLWMVMDAMGVFSTVGGTISEATGSNESNGFDLQSFLSLPRVLLFTSVIAVIDVVLATALATLGAFIYNLSAGFVGGVELTLAEDE
ncbi:Transmembrane protein of unknown function [Streptomyces wuyuanensis]|uniref:DUF3566 domain-containing protein n=1 Tax=Streptomyces wuyuanensis TaxID=1196353 RepID=A0A1G9UL37_9ACTN|nr:Transmembrane protein of unknown function [Streptomyces wuyuanensis]